MTLVQARDRHAGRVCHGDSFQFAVIPAVDGGSSTAAFCKHAAAVLWQVGQFCVETERGMWVPQGGEMREAASVSDC